jgi:alpha-tubulin suppressor-like RCC1 family protein
MGDNSRGQLGNNSTAFPGSGVAVEVSGISNAVAVSAGPFHTCAILADGEARCWGENYSGQIGDGSTVDKLTPADVLYETYPEKVVESQDVGKYIIARVTGKNALGSSSWFTRSTLSIQTE